MNSWVEEVNVYDPEGNRRHTTFEYIKGYNLRVEWPQRAAPRPRRRRRGAAETSE